MTKKCHHLPILLVGLIGALLGCGGSDVTSPIVTSPVITSPVITSPVITSPVITSPVITSPVITSPVVTSPVIALEEITQATRPVDVASRPGDDRLFVVEQSGIVTAIGTGDNAIETVLDITDITGSDSNEQGLLGLAFHPTADLAYVNFTDTSGDTVVAEFAVDPATGAFDRTTLREVLTVDQPFNNHNGGELAFGPDDMLYIGLGDGGSGGDPQRHALDLSSRLGKILRIDPLDAGDQPFTVPDDNPFVDVDGADPTIWSSGLRNPWRFSFDATNGDLWIADVGQNKFEEVNRAPATGGRDAGRGLSFGWSALEGDVVFNDDQSPDGHTPPVLTYEHGDSGCSISGGTIYRGEAIADLVGWYVFGDYCSGRIWGYDPTSPTDDQRVIQLAEFAEVAAVSSDATGELILVSNSGPIARIVGG